MKTAWAFLSLAFFILSCHTKKVENQKLIVNDAVKVSIDSTLKRLVDEGSIAGVSALIIEKGNEVYFNAFGYADREAKLPMDRNTIVRIFSMTKPITGAALMKLYEEGKFQLDDPLSKYAPEFANLKVLNGYNNKGEMVLVEPNRTVTIRDITRHTAGFVNSQPDTTTAFGKLVKKTDAMSRENTLAKMAEKLGGLPLLFHPGAQWSYGPSVDVQAFLVERLSGQPFEQYVSDNILKPLKMNTTQYVVKANDLKRFAALYRKVEGDSLIRIGDEEATSFNLKSWPLKPGGWGLTSTVDDYMRIA